MLRSTLLSATLLVGTFAANRPSLAAAPVTSTQAITMSRPTGTYAVGRRALYVLDSQRADPQAIRPDGRREFMVLVWYPAVGEPPKVADSPWIPGAWADSAAGDLFALTRRATTPPSLAQVRQTIRSTTSWARDSAVVASTGSPFPVLIFSPGNLTMPNYYATLAEELASRGYVVIGHVPTGYSRNVVLPDGRVFPRRPYLDIDGWVGDLRYILEHVATWNRNPSHPLHARLDTLRVGLYGHSGGANAAEMVAASDARVRAIAALDPGLTPDSCATAKPTLLLLAENKEFAAQHTSDATDIANERAAFMRLLQHGHEATILGSEHMSFTDLSAIPDFRTASESPAQLTAARRVLVEFFDEALRGAHSKWLHGETAGDPLVRVGRK